jgi:hypothetical protein
MIAVAPSSFVAAAMEHTEKATRLAMQVFAAPPEPLVDEARKAAELIAKRRR